MNVEQIIRENIGTVVDVRSEEEFEYGHAKGAINIPLYEIQERLEELKQLPQPLVLCCASGNRSGMATAMLSREGVSCVNGGPWYYIHELQTLKAS